MTRWQPVSDVPCLLPSNTQPWQDGWETSTLQWFYHQNHKKTTRWRHSECLTWYNLWISVAILDTAWIAVHSGWLTWTFCRKRSLKLLLVHKLRTAAAMQAARRTTRTSGSLGDPNNVTDISEWNIVACYFIMLSSLPFKWKKIRKRIQFTIKKFFYVEIPEVYLKWKYIT